MQDTTNEMENSASIRENNDDDDDGIDETPSVVVVSESGDVTDDDTVAQDDKTVEAYLNELSSLLENEIWNDLMARIRDAPTILTQHESLRRLGSILGAASSHENVPVELYQIILQEVAGKDAAMYTDAELRTPFHMALGRMDRPDVTKCFLDVCPAIVHARDANGVRGIDILTSKLLMKDEYMRYRYLKDNDTVDDHRSLADCSECVRLVTIHHRRPSDGRTPRGDQQYDYSLPILHACCLARGDIPLSLLERSLRCYGAAQASIRDESGNTPLHYAASYLPTEEMDDLVPRILRVGPGVAATLNDRDELPIDLAIRCGRKWDTGCQLLLEAYPPAILVHQAPDSESAKTIIYILSQRSKYTPIFRILCAKPEILINK